ncbi:MAG: hypothetical protein ACQSGP_11290, partial [Frankia sp.]
MDPVRRTAGVEQVLVDGGLFDLAAPQRHRATLLLGDPAAFGREPRGGRFGRRRHLSTITSRRRSGPAPRPGLTRRPRQPVPTTGA